MEEMTLAEALYTELSSTLAKFIEANPAVDVLEVAQAMAAVQNDFLNSEDEDEEENDPAEELAA